MLQNAYFLAKIDADTAENEQDFVEIELRPSPAGSAGARRARARTLPALGDTPAALTFRTFHSLKSNVARAANKLVDDTRFSTERVTPLFLET